jgi:hypothetical protein
VRYGSLNYRRTHIFRAGEGWRYKGAVHEVALPGKEGALVSAFEGVEYVCNVVDSARDADPEKYKRDAVALEAELASGEGDQRTVYYAAQSWRDYARGLEAGSEAQKEAFAKACALYAARARIPIFPEEQWSAQLNLARAWEGMGEDPEGHYLTAYAMRPGRAESLYSLAWYLNRTGRPHAAALVSADWMGYAAPPVDDVLFIERDAYVYGLADQYALALHYTGRSAEAVIVGEHVVESAPEWDMARVETNLAWYRRGAEGKVAA